MGRYLEFNHRDKGALHCGISVRLTCGRGLTVRELAALLIPRIRGGVGEEPRIVCPGLFRYVVYR
jgi:hypothetical protein